MRDRKMNEHEYIFGANILENLTTGMYQDSKVIYREYIQNSCDQIDKAVKDGLLNKDEGKIEIWLDFEKRRITIEDNATGIPSKEFRKKLGDIANSDKKIEIDKGFRGIGRLCGLAYCKELVFTSKANGEKIISIMYCDAEKMRKMINENAYGQKHTAFDILSSINRFETKNTNDVDSHYFKVELIEVNDENTDLLNSKEIKNYLSFVAPVPYQASFYYRAQIKDHAKELNFKIDEYAITLDGEQIFKRYTKGLKKADNTEFDEVFDVVFHNFYDKQDKTLAWMWIGLTKCKQQIPKINYMRGLRLRKENIQIGGEDTLQKLFKEDRGNSYFVGEVFAVSKDLIPNSQRDYFNENSTRALFEKKLKQYFENELHKVYYTGSAVNSAIRKINSANDLEKKFTNMDEQGLFVNDEHRNEKLKEVEKAKKEAESAHKRIQLEKNKATNISVKVIDQITSKASIPPVLKLTPKKNQDGKQIGNEHEKPIESKKITKRVDKLSSYSQEERDLISKIFDIILKSIDNETAEAVICKIEAGLS